MNLRVLAVAVLLCGLGHSLAFAEPEEGLAKEEGLAEQAYTVMNKYCHRCHIEDGGAPQFDVLNSAVLLNDKRKPRLIWPGKPEDSSIWQMVGEYNAMPPEGSPQPTDEEKAILKSWIEQGAPEFKPGANREPITETTVLQAIKNDLNSLRASDRDRHRYFSLTHMYNNPLVTDLNLRIYRAALSKAINSMSRERQIAELAEVKGTWKTVYRLDLADVGWDDDPQLWLNVLSEYPYGMKWQDELQSELLEEIKGLFTGPAGNGIGAGTPHIRADWFVARATRGKLYKAFLNLPENINDLEKNLGVNIKQDFKTNKVARAGFATSGVSRHNRAIDRYRGSNTAYYYRSWDFGKSFGKGVLFRFPLGPKEVDAGNEFPQQAFEADGGEVVWSLANGMQGYYICDKEGKFLDPAPVSIVRDLSEIAGSPAVENGISCMGCHKRGVVTFTDAIRESFTPGGAAARRKVQEIYPDPDKLKKLVDDDVDVFLRALDKTIGPYLREGEDKGASIDDLVKLPEPIAALAKAYQAELGVEEVASELGMNPKDLAAAIKNDEDMQKLGLGPLSKNSKIVREMWDSREGSAASLYQLAAKNLSLGAPDNIGSNAAATPKSN